jgi:hypothetical protein
VAILKYVGTADWDRERLNMPVNTPASWSAHALSTRLGMLSGPAALRGLSMTLCYPQNGPKKVLRLSGSKTVSAMWLVFPL